MRTKLIRGNILAVLVFLLSAGAGGCRFEPKPLINDITPTPAVQPVMTQEPTPTPIPAPTAFPVQNVSAPVMIRVFGSKSDSSGSFLLTNHSRSPIREIYLSSADKGQWGRNLLPRETSIREGEQVQIYYPASDSENLYDIRITDGNGSWHEIYSVNLPSIPSASLERNENWEYYFSYQDGSQSAPSDPASKTDDDDSDVENDEEEYPYEYDSDGWEVYYFDDDTDYGTGDDYWDYVSE
ncbi:MAG: hypothetical protein IKE58_02935 [Blautia sp.]|nr:hypothetical protein [Blautia sp.]